MVKPLAHGGHVVGRLFSALPSPRMWQTPEKLTSDPSKHGVLTYHQAFPKYLGEHSDWPMELFISPQNFFLTLWTPLPGLASGA